MNVSIKVAVIGGSRAEADARLLTAHTGLDAFPVTGRDPLPRDTTAVFLTGAPGRSVRCVAGTLPVITEDDTRGIALTVAAHVALRRRDVAPFAARAVVVGAAVLPVLVPLLVATGIADITSWSPADARFFPLHQIVRDTDLVLDLAGHDATAPVPVIRPGDPVEHLLALPGLVHALAGAQSRNEDPFAHIEAHRACVHALTGLVPVDRELPELSDPDLTDRVAAAITEALRPPCP